MPSHSVTQAGLIQLFAPMLAVLALAACAKEPPPAAPQEINQATVCSLDGMTLLDYPGPKAQIQYADGSIEYFCDTVEMFSIGLRPEQQRRVRAIYTQDMAKADWRQPKGQWIDARGAYYVRGSSQRGSMGPTLAAFATRADADAFARQYGGSVLAFAEVTLDMVDLHGGAAHDRAM
jgi:copper chaperone NosL